MNGELERGKPYEWIVTDCEDHPSKTGFIKSIQYKCLSEKVVVREHFWLDEKKRCPSLDSRNQLLNGKSNGDYPFTLGFRFFAKTLVTITPGRRGKRTYIFDPDSFTLSAQKEKPPASKEKDTETIRKEIETMALSIMTRPERFAWCEKQGVAYMRAFRKMEQDGVI